MTPVVVRTVRLPLVLIVAEHVSTDCSFVLEA